MYDFVKKLTFELGPSTTKRHFRIISKDKLSEYLGFEVYWTKIVLPTGHEVIVSAEGYDHMIPPHLLNPTN